MRSLARPLASAVAAPYKTFPVTRTGRLHALRAQAGMAVSRGAFIVFEGIDRCGKSTQSSKLVEYLKSQDVAVELWRFPDRDCKKTGQIISSYLSKDIDLEDETIHLLFSANRWEKRALIESKLRAGITLVVDRYAYSGIAYSAAKKRPHMTIDWCMASDNGLPAPDRVLYMQISPEATAQRGGYGNERYEKLAFQTTVASMFEQLKDSRWVSIDATQSVNAIHEQVVAEAMRVIKTVSAPTCPIGTLWGREITISGSVPSSAIPVSQDHPDKVPHATTTHTEADNVLGRDQQTV